ncbi:hypothetical protein PM082_021000 [Marasmius tenuissimus]|nr:hypothetical protein PM082_021000 [Marasmius tenuissimus]
MQGPQSGGGSHTPYQNNNYGRDQNNNYGRDQNIQNINHLGYQNINSGVQVGQVVGDVTNNTFETAVVTPYQRLLNTIAGVGASHKAEKQFERGHCLPGTRTKALELIHDWASSREHDHPICWLSGAAGVGKSAIALTMAKSLEDKDLLASSFFFFRSDPKRHNPSSLMLSIAHDLASTTPLIKQHIENILTGNPKILDATLEDQFHELILGPALAWSRQRFLCGAPAAPSIVIIDGLDECGDEETQLRIISIIQSACQQTSHVPLRFLICSRPEAWIQEAFAAESLSQLSKMIALDDSLEAREDIRQYCLHHFQEIISSPKYSQIQFPKPWPSSTDLEILVERSCSQFVYVVTVVKHVKLAFKHPVDQLKFIIEKTSPRRPGTTPYRQIDVLYDFILSSNPVYEDVLPILAAILILPSHLPPSPACIELLCGLPSGQVALTLRAMHSVLDICRWEDAIMLYHTSFRDCLTDQSRSRHFHVNVHIWEVVILRQWLQSLTAVKIRTLSFGQLRGQTSKLFFIGWMEFCLSIPKPTRDLLGDLWNVDLAFTFLHFVDMTGLPTYWGGVFGRMKSWVKRYEGLGPGANEYGKPGGNTENIHDYPRPEVDNHPYRANDQDEDMACCEKPDKGRDGFDLMRKLVYKLGNYPKCFHLERRPDAVSPVTFNNIFWVVLSAAGRGRDSMKAQSSPIQWLYLTDCHCDHLSKGNESESHLRYRVACRKVAKACILRFRRLIASSTLKGERASHALQRMFRMLVQTPILKHCHLDTELLSLCRIFFELIELTRGGKYNHQRHHFPWNLYGYAERHNLLDWIESFPAEFAKEGKTLKMQVPALYWDGRKSRVGRKADEREFRKIVKNMQRPLRVNEQLNTLP